MLRLSVLSLTLMPGPLLYLIYSALVWLHPELALALLPARKEFAGLVAGFSFAMLGFLAGIITVLFAVTQSEAFRRYQRKGYLDVFFTLYRFAIFNLAVTALLAVTGFSHTPWVWAFRFMGMSFVNNIVQVVAIAYIISSLAKQAHDTPGA